MNRWLLLLLLATRFDCVCISYNASAASGSCPATETSNQENCCANFPTMVGSFNVDADGETKQCDCCCSSCPEDAQSVCIQSTGEDVPKPSATVCSSDDDCAGIPAGDCCRYSCDGGTCSSMRCEVNQFQQCTSATDSPIPNDRYCSYTCENFSEVSGEANTCMLVCQGGGVPVRPPAMYVSVCARTPRSTAPLTPLAALFPLTSAAPLRRLSHRRSPARPAA